MFDRRTRTVLALVVVAALPHVSMAEPHVSMEKDGPWSRPGLYVGLAGNAAFSTGIESELGGLTGLGVSVDPSLGLHARAGYRFHPRLAAEAHYEWVSGFDISAAGLDVLSVDGHTVTADMKGFLMTGRWQPFGLIGLGFTNGKVSDTVGAGLSIDETAFAARFGGGIDVYLTESVALTFDTSYVLPTGDLDGFDYVSLGWGLQYRFDGAPWAGL